MRGTRAKQIRQIAREIATENTIPEQTQHEYNINPRNRCQGNIVVVSCERAVINQVKKVSRAAKYLPARLFQQIAYHAIG